MKTAVITGGSRGIGKEIALRLARAGFDIAVLYVGIPADAESACREIAAVGVKARAYECNIADFEQVKKVSEKVFSDFGGINVLVNNAGITRDNLTIRMSESEFDSVIAVNLKGAFNCSKHFMRALMKSESGRIINIASISGITGNAGQTNYSASKAGLIGLTKTLAKELAGKNVTVNAIAPGFIDTAMTAVMDENIKEQIKSSIPLKRMGSVADIVRRPLRFWQVPAHRIGAITPLGHDVKNSWDGVVAGKNGIGPITRFDATDYKVKIAAEVKDYNSEKYFDKMEARKMDLFTQFALIAAREAVDDSAHIAIKFNAKGPNLPVVTACATSTHAIGEAFYAIRSGRADAIIAGGAEAAVVGLGVAGFINCMALSTSTDINAASLPFDKRRAGFVMGEGGAMLVLEDYDHAKARGAKIYCELVGYANTCDAYHVTAPHPEGEGFIRIFKAVEMAQICDDEKIYINPHGTGTELNDKTETFAIKAVFGEKAKTIPYHSTKSMTGHMLGATGAFEAIVAIKTLEQGIVPPTINLNEPDPECDLDYVPNVMRKYNADVAISTNLGFGGHNAGLVFRKLS
ncbi:polyketide synthase-related [Holotrichia oblita]|nr:polyketide synthase-related [Holotrichia oblita]